MITFQADATPLRDSARRWDVLAGSYVGSPVSIVDNSLKIPGMSGSIFSGQRPYESAQYVLKMKVRGNTDAEMMRNYTALTGHLARTATLTRNDGAQNLTAVVALVSASDPTYLTASRMCLVTYTFALPEVFWRSANAVWNKAGVTINSNNRVTTLDGSSGTVLDASIMVNGPITAPKITDVTTGEWVAVDVILAAGTDLRIDTDKWEAVTGSGIGWSGVGTSVSNKITASSGRYLLAMTPRTVAADPTDTMIQLRLNGSGASSATGLQVSAKGAYIV